MPPRPATTLSLLITAACAFAAFAPAKATSSPPGSSPLVTIEIDGKPLPIPAHAPCLIPNTTREVFFHVGSQRPNDPTAIAFRFQFEGVDPGWRRMDGLMRLGVRFYNEKGDFVGQESFTASGQSSGWKETVDNSILTHRRRLIKVPANGRLMQVFISSAGPPSVVGIYVVSDIVASRLSKDGSTSAPILDSAAFLSREANASSPASEEWIRDGDHSAMAQLIPIGGPGFKDHAFCLLDDDPLSHAEWHQRKDLSAKVSPGEQLVLQWNEMFNIEEANSFTIAYHRLKPGNYRFRVNELDTIGLPTPRETIVNITIPLPFWKNPWVWAAAFLLLGFLVFFITRYAIRIKMRRDLEHLQRERMVEQERLRISRNIHDDLGARLTQISLASGLAEKEAATEADCGKFKEISGMARELVAAMYETVWTVNPQNDNLESLVSFLFQSTENLCKPAGIRCRINASPIPENRQVHSEVRHNVNLAVKETVHNAMKHSRASEIELLIAFDETFMIISVSDNGCGFDPGQNTSGHGLKNQRRRMEAIGGSVSLTSSSPTGTRVQFLVPIP